MDNWKWKEEKWQIKRTPVFCFVLFCFVLFFFSFCFSLFKPLKFVLVLSKWEFSTGEKHFTPGKNREKLLCPSEKYSSYAPDLYKLLSTKLFLMLTHGVPELQKETERKKLHFHLQYHGASTRSQLLFSWICENFKFCFVLFLFFSCEVAS